MVIAAVLLEMNAQTEDISVAQGAGTGYNRVLEYLKRNYGLKLREFGDAANKTGSENHFRKRKQTAGCFCCFENPILATFVTERTHDTSRGNRTVMASLKT
jgi:hypothetical protein